MNNPVLWLCLSFVLLAVSLTAVFVVLIPAVVELSRAARSFEKLCNTLDRDLPPTLDSLRQTTAEITRLTDDVNTSVQNAGRVAQQVDQSVSTVRSQAKRAQVNTRSLMSGLGAAWATFNQTDTHRDRSASVPTATSKTSNRHPSEPIASPPPVDTQDIPQELDAPTTANAEVLGSQDGRDRPHTNSPRETSVANDAPSQTSPD